MGKLDQEIEKHDELSSRAEGNGNPRTSGGSLWMVLKHSDRTDVLLMVLGTIGCISDGMCMPALLLVLSHLTNGYAAASSLTLEDINKYALALLYVAVCVGSSAFLEGFCWARTAERQTSRVRTKYLQAVLRQDVGFFDTVHGASMTSQVVSSLSTDMLTIQGVLSEKIPNFIMNMALFITAQVAALYLCWRLAIIGIPALSILIIPGMVYGKLLAGVGEKIQEAYAVAGGVVEQALSLIRTVYSYVGEERTVKSYSTALEPTLTLGIKQGLMKGMAIGSVGITYAVWALQGWYGSILVTKKGVKGGDAFTAGVCVVFAGLGLGSSLINVKYFMEANAASAFIFDMIEHVPSIDSADRQGKTISNVKGELEFKDIDFAYPSRPGSLVLRNFNLKVMACQTVGLVGRSGSGKSTVINLLQRFYDPLRGEILLDGISIKAIQLYWLRSQMGLVNQEPILFATSIKENILFGKEGASQDEIVQAAKAANAHNFITQLPNGYDTLVGQLGIQMSGGQKQRISIARALLRDPRILLLDEATSSLDSQSEKAVQDALNQASLGRTTVIIAHRLSALCNADLIAVIQNGQVVESGSHDQLIQDRHGQYSAMVQLQKILMYDVSTSKFERTEINNSPSPIKYTHKAGASNNLIHHLSSPNKKTYQQTEELDGPLSLWQLIQMTTPEWKSKFKRTEINDSPSPIKCAHKAGASNNLIHHLSSPNKKTYQQPEELDGPLSLWQLIQMTTPEWKWKSKFERTEINDSPSPIKCTHKAGASNNLIHHLSSPNKKTYQQPEELDGPLSLWQLIQMTTPEWKSTLLGCIGALCFGLIQPWESFCMGALLSVYYINDHDEIRSQTRIYCFAFLSFAIFAFITNVIQHYHFGIMGENLTKRVREEVFAKIMTFEIEWFDKETNNSGALCSRLATDATMVRTLVADRLAFFTQAISSATLAVILGLLLAWKFALAAIALQPLIMGAFYIKAVMMRTMSKKILKAQNRSSELASEAIGNHRIITAFYSQEKVMALFEATQIGPRKESHKQSLYAGLGLFTSQFLYAAIPALLFWYGGKLLYHGNIAYKHLFQTFFILVSTGRVIAETGSMTADLSKGTSALKSIFTILRRKGKMDSDEPNGINPEKINGDIELKEVDFFYPTRPKQMILTNLSLKIDAGKVVALVGQSGCGKSTIIRMIERFYDPLNGSVEIDGIDIKSYNVRSLRSHIAWVGQEPTLFAGTIHENIAYGKENATEAEIIEAATLANAHEFISSMKDGYETYCGERGVQLSGGQKQRIVLARAMLKNPAILLLDEATSALDIQSENLVQDALEKTMVGRTCLVVAHRLSTVQKSYKIIVIHNGRMVEEGSHSELIAKGERSAYFSLVSLQQQASMK